MTDTTTHRDRLLRLHDVLKRVPVSRSVWYEGLKTGRFPAPVMLGPRLPAWRESTIDALIENLPTQRD